MYCNVLYYLLVLLLVQWIYYYTLLGILLHQDFYGDNMQQTLMCYIHDHAWDTDLLDGCLV